VAIALAACALAADEGPVPSLAQDRRALAGICRDAEALGAGVRCGIMDPFASLHGRDGAAILLDCRSLATRAVSLPTARLAFVVADSGVRHTLGTTEYGRRRDDCEEAARRLGVRTLRDVSSSTVEQTAPALGPDLFRRARHVVTENERVLRAASALETGDLDTFGYLLDASHASLRDDFEVSCRELDVLVEIARKVPGVYGSRMVGGGFGGSTVTALRPDAVTALVDAFRDEGRRHLGRPIEARRVEPSAGASVERTA
jgi:galactokinase